MKKTKQLIAFLLLIIISSCSVSDKVVTGKIIQKRKYTNGFYVAVPERKSQISKKQIENEFEKMTILELKRSFSSKKEVDALFVTSVDAKTVPVIGNVCNDRQRILPVCQANELLNNEEFESTNSLIENVTDIAHVNNNTESADDVANNQIIATVLCLLGFAFIAGLHRIYLGYYGLGVLMLLTAGFCGILTIIDLIRIITGDLQPKNGRYTSGF